MCKHYRDNAATCGADEEAKDYCGSYREFNKIESAKSNEIVTLPVL